MKVKRALAKDMKADKALMHSLSMKKAHHRKHMRESEAEKLGHERSGMERALHKMGDHTRHKRPETKAERLEHERKGMLGHMTHKKHVARAHKIAKSLMHEHMKNTPKDKMKFVMKEFKEDKLHSGSKKGPLVKNPKQAVAIAYSEARKKRK